MITHPRTEHAIKILLDAAYQKIVRVVDRVPTDDKSELFRMEADCMLSAIHRYHNARREEIANEMSIGQAAVGQPDHGRLEGI